MWVDLGVESVRRVKAGRNGSVTGSARGTKAKVRAATVAYAVS